MSVSAILLKIAEHVQNLELTWVPHPDGGQELQVKIDGLLLEELATSWELEHAPENERKLAGNYGGLREWSARHLTDWLDFEGDAKAFFLGCSCGDLLCWSLHSHIRTVNDQQIICFDFSQIHRPETWPYHGFGPFTFHRAQYEAEVRRAIAQAPTSV